MMTQTIKKLTYLWKNVLQNARIDGNRLYMQWQLDRKDYVELMKVLEAMGWKRDKKQKCHIFDTENLKEAIDEICETMEVVDVKVLYQQYYTPPELAKRLVELACIGDTDCVLEPSAGHGAIVQAIIEKKPDYLVAVEIDANNYNHLRSNYFLENKKYSLVEGNFLTLDKEKLFDKIIANPPFSKSQDVKHILKMYEHLKEWGRIVSIASESIRTREGKLYDDFKALNPEFIEIEDWAFKGSGTMVNSLIVIVNK